jgi:predicted AAA+ superfamily ATPase
VPGHAPTLGAFTSLDDVAGSAQNPLSLNRFLYAADPETLVDQMYCIGLPDCSVDWRPVVAHWRASLRERVGRVQRRMEYLRRVVDLELDELLPGVPAIAIEGPKAVGKTATATHRARTIVRLDDDGELAIAAADPRRLAAGQPPILIDEWQRLPESWDVIRRAVDADGTPGRFLLTGSATPSEASTHSGAGRIITVRMRPMTLPERGVSQPTVSVGRLLAGTGEIEGSASLSLDEYVEQIVSSGFPAIRNLTDRPLRAALDGYIDRIVERDFAMLGRPIRNPAALRRWMTAYAAATSTTASFESIRDAATSGDGEKPARTTVVPYIDILQRLWIVEPVPAWFPTRNAIRRLAGPPKHHVADPALAARLLGVGADGLLAGRQIGPGVERQGTLLGSLFESLVTLSVRVFAQAAEARVLHFRTKGGEHEVDLIIEAPDRRVIAIEAKLGRTVGDADVRHLTWLRAQLGDGLIDSIVVTTGDRAYRRADGIAVVPLALLGP